jgi:type IV pilus assembly protein PilB
MSKEPMDLYRRNIPPEVIALIPGSVAKENLLVPVKLVSDRLVVALVDPGRANVLAKLRFILNRPVHGAEVTREAMDFALLRYYPEEYEQDDALEE